MFKSTATVIEVGDGKIRMLLKLSEKRSLTLIIIGARKEEQQKAALMLYKEDILNVSIEESMWRSAGV